MSVRPADSAATPAVQPHQPAAAPAQANPATETNKAQAPQQATAVPDSFAMRSGGGLSLPSPGDLWNKVTNVFDQVKSAASDVWGGAKDLASKGASALNKLVSEDIPGFGREV